MNHEGGDRMDAAWRWGDLTAELERQLGRGLQAGDLCVVMARAGVGKTTFLVQLGLGQALLGRDVVHITLNSSVAQVQAYYDSLYKTGATHLQRHAREALRNDWIRRRGVRAYADGRLSPNRLEETLNTFSRHLKLSPSLILIDGNDWQAVGPEHLEAYKQHARSAGAVLWLLARVSGRPTQLPSPVREAADRVDLAVLLEPGPSGVDVRPLWASGQTPDEFPQLLLEAGTLRPLAARPAPDRADRLEPAACTLLSGAAAGAEAEFGACAERWGVEERNFTFAGRKVARPRGLWVLSAEELRQGDVSWAYLKRRLKRKFEETDAFRQVLQSIWHQVNPAGEVFAVGRLQPDGTFKGGTGWAVELAKQMNKPVWVFDQNREQWFCWEAGAWQPAHPPRINRPRFAGGGTRSLNPSGRSAIQDLFARTFGHKEGKE
jgi:hypothetical protein